MTPADIRRAQRRADALTKRLGGMPARDIAAEAGVSRKTTDRDLTAALKDLGASPEAIHLRTISHLRLEDLYLGLQPALASDDPMTRIAAATAAVKIILAEDRLMGLDMPAQHEHTVIRETPLDIEIRGLIEAQREKNLQARQGITSAPPRNAPGTGTP